ncbi:MAG: zinc ribbon domain-containing protein [Pseudomonadota bacterium]|nr:MAG: hypothetical protein DIU78_09630 [Pseudomonadota bacterium]
MPIYEYECTVHGAFEGMGRMADARANAPCPSCGLESRRILSPPAVARLPRATVRAHERNERSRHEPRLVQREPAPQTEEGRARPARSAGGHPWAIAHG